MTDPSRKYFSTNEVNRSFEKIEQILSTQKARDCVREAEQALAFDIEVFLHPIRLDLAECLEIVATLVRERGTLGKEIDKVTPKLMEWLDPGSDFAKEVARLEKHIAEKKRKHPDFVLAFKLQMLIRKFEEELKSIPPDTGPYFDLEDKIKKTKTTLSNHSSTKLRIAQRAFAPDMLELAVAQLELAKHQEKVLRLKQELLHQASSHAKQNLGQIANLFKDIDPELAQHIIAQTSTISNVGALTESANRLQVPKNLGEYRKALAEKGETLGRINNQLDTCREQLDKLLLFEEAIFNSFGDKLRERGIQFKKPVTIEKSGSGLGALTKQTGARMTTRRSAR